MRIYKENISPKQMMDSSTPFCRQVREGLLCWTYTEEGKLFPSHPSRIWFDNTEWKEPAIISNIDEWVSIWAPVYDLGGIFKRNMIIRLRELGNDIDNLYWDGEFGKSGGLHHLLSLLPKPIEDHLLFDIIEDMPKRYEINLDKDYWFNQRHTINFWANQHGLSHYIGSLQYKIGLSKIEETNSIIREWIPTLKPYMDNRQFWEDFFKGAKQ